MKGTRNQQNGAAMLRRSMVPKEVTIGIGRSWRILAA